MTIADDLQQGGYLNECGMVSNNTGSCDNYWLYTAEAQKLEYFGSKVNRFYEACKVEPGLFHRGPGRTDDISQDELFGAAYLSSIIADEIYDYGKNHWWCFNAAQPGKFKINYWYARYINLIPFVKRCAGHPVGSLGQILWSISCIMSATTPYGETSGKLLMWIQLPAMESLTICRHATRLWKWIMRRKYPGGLQEIMGIYFGAAHPMTKYAERMF